jgi:5-methylcytosine-specific restriction endonuclease McrA
MSYIKGKSDEEKSKNNALRQSRYRAKKLRAIDETADKQKICEFYMKRPEGYEVDHIIPLSKGGKHHQDNLQYLTKDENRKKGNRWS